VSPGAVIWLTGLPSSGKSTLAEWVRKELERRATPCCVLDGDEVRAALVPAPSYDSGDRAAFYATLANLAALLARQGLVVLVPATANRRAYREHARKAAPRFVEVYVSTPHEECARRDTKGLYARASAGTVAELPGVGSAYEPPLTPEVVAPRGADEAAVRHVLGALDGATEA
jgi:adenylylsulfate kinase